MKLFSVLGYLGMVGALVALLAMRSLFSAAPAVIVAQLVAILLFFWARLTFGRRSFHVAANPTEGGLVTTGPYRYIRHPIYSAMCLFAWAGVLGHWSIGSALCGLVALACALVRIYCEETLVKARYPEYAQYAFRTWPLFPGIF
jgi:protein-S-isoprenylcysteine O-methyltransferase Ste14